MSKIKFIAIALTLVFLVGCGNPTADEPTVHTRYTTFGRYYTDGTVITDDGNIWGYSTDTVSDKAVYDGMPIWIGFDDNGTVEIEDDIILGLVFDMYTAIYDELETSFSDDFNVDRDGNKLTISFKEE